jgi:hypothetical protein
LKEVLRRSLGNLFNNCLEFHLDTKGFLPKHSFNHSVRGSRSLPKTGHVRSSLLQRHTTCFGLPKVFLQANRDIFTWQRLLLYQRQLRLVLARPRSSSPHVKDLVINPLGPTVIFLQVNKWILMVRLRIWLKLLEGFIYLSLIDFQSPLHTSSNTLLVFDWYAILLKGTHSHIFSNAPFY